MKTRKEIAQLTAKCSGDPRGYCLHLFSAYPKRPLATNSWGGEESGFAL